MKKRIINKLRSRSGASITYGLLLFLVCAVLCSVIIAAATTAAGRISKIAEADQKYYAVTSAAELLKDMFDGNSAKVEKITTGGSRTYKGGKISSETVGTDYSYKVDGTPVTGSNKFNSILSDAAYKFMSMNEPGGASTLTEELTLVLPSGDGTSKGWEKSKVKITETVNKDGRVIFVVKNDVSGEDYYQMVLEFAATVSPNSYETPGTSTTSDTGDSYTVNIIKTDETTLTWILTGVRAGA